MLDGAYLYMLDFESDLPQKFMMHDKLQTLLVNILLLIIGFETLKELLGISY